MRRDYFLHLFHALHSVLSDRKLSPAEVAQERADIDDACVTALVSRKLKKDGKITSSLSLRQCWENTRSGIAQMLSPEYGEKKTRVARKVALHRRSKDEDIQLRATAAYDIAVAKTPAPDTEPASDALRCRQSIYLRKNAKEQLLWAKTVADVASKVTDIKTACAKLKKETKKNVPIRVMKNAVKRFIHAADENAEPLMLWETVRETRGRPTSLHAADEAECADVVQYFLDKRLYFHWSLIQSIARSKFMQRCPNVPVATIEKLFTYRWYTGFLKRNKLVVTTLRKQDSKRSNSATAYAVHQCLLALGETAERLGLGVKNPDYDPKVEGSVLFRWHEDKKRCAGTCDETSADLNQDGTNRLKFVARKGELSPRIDSPSIAFRASIMGTRLLNGLSPAPMVVTQNSYKFKPGSLGIDDITGTVQLADGSPQPSRWKHNDKGSFDSDMFADFLEHVWTPATNSSTETPTLLICDGVGTHVTLHVLLTAQRLGITLFILPPNCTHILQGEDLVNFPVFKQAFSKRKWEYVTSMSLTACMLNAASADELTRYVDFRCMAQNFVNLMRDAWKKAFHNKDLNDKGFEAQGLLPDVNTRVLDKNFPNWREEIFEPTTPVTDEATVASPAETSPVVPIALVTAFDAYATQAEARCTLPATAAVDGNPDSIHRVVPLVSALRLIACNGPGMNEMTPETFRETLETAANSLESLVLKVWHRSQVGRRSRVRHEVTTLEQIEKLQAAQQRQENNPERAQRARESLERRLAYIDELQSKIERGELLENPLTIVNLTDVIKALFSRKKCKQGCPQRPTRSNLVPIIQEAWPELLEFEAQSVCAGAVKRKRGAQAQPAAAGDKSESESDGDNDNVDDDETANDEERRARCDSGNVTHSPIDEDSRSHAPAAANLRTSVQRSKRTRENDSELRGQTKHTEKRRKSTRSLATTSMDTAKSTENALPEHPAYRATATGARQVTVQVMPSHSNSGGDDIFGCASCRGRLTGCTRCYKFHADGKQKVGFSANGYPTWGFPHA